MRIGSEPWCELIAAGAKELGVTIASGQIMQFARHAELLVSWNRKINLTAITDPEQMAVKHYLDVMAALPYVPEDVELLDIGTGGGFPGIPLKIMHPFQPMTLIDSSRKKISFVKEVIRSLSLEQVQGIQVRAEELARQTAHRQRYGVVVCRAVAGLPAIMKLALPLLAPAGRIVAFKGPQESPTESSKETAGDLTVEILFNSMHIDYRLPVSGDPRTLVVMTKCH